MHSQLEGVPQPDSLRGRSTDLTMVINHVSPSKSWHDPNQVVGYHISSLIPPPKLKREEKHTFQLIPTKRLVGDFNPVEKLCKPQNGFIFPKGKKQKELQAHLGDLLRKQT